MATSNKLVRKPKPKPVADHVMGGPTSTSEALRQKERVLRRKVHRMKVEMAASRMGFPMGSQHRMTYAQAAAKRRRFLVQAAEFITTAILFVGACSWLYHWWLSRQ
jgi:hypothetical protein